jgi:hypothetical protein
VVALMFCVQAKVHERRTNVLLLDMVNDPLPVPKDLNTKPVMLADLSFALSVMVRAVPVLFPIHSVAGSIGV